MLVLLALGTHKVAAVDIVEFNPALDTDGNSARVAGRIAWDVAQGWAIPGALVARPRNAGETPALPGEET